MYYKPTSRSKCVVENWIIAVAGILLLMHFFGSPDQPDTFNLIKKINLSFRHMGRIAKPLIISPVNIMAW